MKTLASGKRKLKSIFFLVTTYLKGCVDVYCARTATCI